MEKRYNYTYKLTLKKDPRYYYFGKHSTNLNPDIDPYCGSGTEVRELKKQLGSDCFIREILSFYDTKKKVLQAEKELIGSLWKADPFCLNRVPGGIFDCTGLIHVTRNGVNRSIDPEQLSLFEAEGWIKGQTTKKDSPIRKRAVAELWKDPEYREHQRLSHLGNKSHLGCKVSEEGRKRMSEAGRHPKPWLKGREISEAQRKASSERNKQFRWVSKDAEVRRIHISDLQQFLEKGWIQGRTGFVGRKKK